MQRPLDEAHSDGWSEMVSMAEVIGGTGGSVPY